MDSSSKTKTTSNRKREKKKKMVLVASKKEQFHASYIPHQRIAFPDSMMHFITTKTPEVYQKLAMSCKYFFVKNPILIVSCMNYVYNERKATLNGYEKSINVANVSKSKFWITDTFHVHSRINKKYQILSSFIPHIYRCDAKKFTILNEEISFEQFLFLSSNATDIDFYHVSVKYRDDTVVPLEKLIEACVNVKNFCHESVSTSATNITVKTFNELIKIPHFSMLDSFVLNNIHEDFDIESFYIHMKKNKQIKFRLHFAETISDAYKNRLKEIADEIYALYQKKGKYLFYKPPFIDCTGFDYSTRMHMRSIRY